MSQIVDLKVMTIFEDTYMSKSKHFRELLHRRLTLQINLHKKKLKSYINNKRHDGERVRNPRKRFSERL